VEATVSKLAAALALAIVATVGACKKTGEGEYQVKGPDVDKTGDTITIGTDTGTVRTPTVDAGMKKDTLVVPRPTVDVKTPAERKGDTAATKRP
jgi:hypothetical protein